MNEKTQRIYDKLTECKLTEFHRMYVMNPNTNMVCLVCQLMLLDRFKSFEELLIAIKECLKGIPVFISEIIKGRISILPDQN